jgi:hypothetical protein
MIYPLLAFDCACCSRPIVLPIPTRAGILGRRQQHSSKGIWPKNILCPACKHVRVYSPDMRRPHISLDKGQAERTVLCAELPCDELGCVFPVKILLAVDEATENPQPPVGQPQMDLLHQAIVGEISCPKGHRWNGQIQSTPIKIWSNLDWL